jgi:hypothetical protein
MLKEPSNLLVSQGCAKSDDYWYDMGAVPAMGTAYAISGDRHIYEEIVDVDGRPLTNNSPKPIGFIWS